MVSLEQSKGVVRMRWVARSLGLVWGIWILATLVERCLLFWPWPEEAAWFVLFIFLGLLPIVMVVIAWRWSGRLAEAISGAVFIIYGGAYPFYSGFPSPPFPYVIRMALFGICLPVTIGILFILAYRRSLAKG